MSTAAAGRGGRGGRGGRPRKGPTECPSDLVSLGGRLCRRCHTWKAASGFASETADRCRDCAEINRQRAQQRRNELAQQRQQEQQAQLQPSVVLPIRTSMQPQASPPTIGLSQDTYTARDELATIQRNQRAHQREEFETPALPGSQDPRLYHKRDLPRQPPPDVVRVRSNATT